MMFSSPQWEHQRCPPSRSYVFDVNRPLLYFPHFPQMYSTFGEMPISMAGLQFHALNLVHFTLTTLTPI